MKMQAWHVYLGDNHIDSVYFSIYTTAEEVKRSLVEHDGLHPDIVVFKSYNNY